MRLLKMTCIWLVVGTVMHIPLNKAIEGEVFIDTPCESASSEDSSSSRISSASYLRDRFIQVASGIGKKKRSSLSDQELETAFFKKKAHIRGVAANGTVESVIDLVKNDLFKSGSRFYPSAEAIKKIVNKYWGELGNVSVVQFGGGAFTGILFAVKAEAQPGKNVFFVKVSSGDAQNAAEHLKQLQESRVGRIILDALRSRKSYYQDLPIMTSVEALFRYKAPDLKEYTIEVTHAARGNELYTTLKSTNAEHYDIGFSVGKALGNFHIACMQTAPKGDPALWKTVTHNDLHPKNIFVHALEKSHRVYFIDNETMASSLSTPNSILRDVMYLIAVPAVYWNASIIPYWSNYKQFFDGLLQGYVAAYPEEERVSLAQYLGKSLEMRVNMLDKASITWDEDKAEEDFFFYISRDIATKVRSAQCNDLKQLATKLKDAQ